MFVELKEEKMEEEEQLNGQDNVQNSGMENSEVDSDPVLNNGLAASFLNMAVNLEHLGNFQKALETAHQGYNFALIDLGANKNITNNLKYLVARLKVKTENASRQARRFGGKPSIWKQRMAETFARKTSPRKDFV